MLIERKIIVGLIISDDFHKRIRDIWDDSLVESPEMKWIARTCFDYVHKYGRAPDRDIDQLYLSAIRADAVPKDTAQLIELALKSVSDEYGTGEQFNAAYLVDETIQYFRERALKVGLAEADDMVQRQRFDQAIVAMTEAAASAVAMAPIDGDLSRARIAAWQIASASAPAERLPDPWGDPEPPPFDLDVLPPVLREYARVQSATIGCHAGPMAWAAIAACGAAIDASTRLQMKASDPTFTVPPGIWMLLIAKPSQLKSPVLKAAFAPHQKVQRERLKAWRQDEKEWSAQDPKTRGPEPRLDQIVTQDATIEGIRDALAGRDRRIAVLCDEWAQHIGSMGRYSGGKDAGAADRGFYNSAFDGGPYTSNRANRKGGELIVVENLQVTIVGGVQPGILHQNNRHGELLVDGMLQRSCPILMGRPAIGRDDPDGWKARRRFEALITRLVGAPGNRTVRMSPEAEAVRRRVEAHFLTLSQSEALGPGFATAAGKLHGIWGRLALILQHVRSVYERGELPDLVEQKAAERAERLVMDSLLPNMALFYQMLGAGGDVETTKAIAAFLLREKRVRITARDVIQHVGMLHRSKADQVREALSPIINMGWLDPEEGDERQSRAWLVNPAIYQQFAEQALKARADAALARDLIRTGRNDGPNVYDVYCAGEIDYCETPSTEEVHPAAPPAPRAHNKQHKQIDRSSRRAVIRNALRSANGTNKDDAH